MVMEKPGMVRRKRGRPKTILRTDPKPILPLFPKVPFEPVLVTPLHILSQPHVEQQQTKQVLNITFKQNGSSLQDGVADKPSDVSPSPKERASLGAAIMEANGRKSSALRKMRCIHNAEEKRRKARINQWITKLGELVCKERDERKSKNAILEHVFNFVKEKKNVNMEEGQQLKDEVVLQLTVRVKHLESLVVLLIQLLKKHSISVPDCVNVKKYTGVSSLEHVLQTEERQDNYDDTQAHFLVDASACNFEHGTTMAVASLGSPTPALDSNQSKDLTGPTSQITPILKNAVLSQSVESTDPASIHANQIKVADLWRPVESLLNKPTLACDSAELPDRNLTKVTYVVTPSMALCADGKDTVGAKDSIPVSNSPVGDVYIADVTKNKDGMQPAMPTSSSCDGNVLALTDTVHPRTSERFGYIGAAISPNSPKNDDQTQIVCQSWNSVTQEDSTPTTLERNAVSTTTKNSLQNIVISKQASSLVAKSQSCSSVVTVKTSVNNIQSFGIDSILINQDITTPSDSDQSRSSLTTVPPKRTCPVSRHKKRKSKVCLQPDATSQCKESGVCRPKTACGHTVAALLENVDQSLASVKQSGNSTLVTRSRSKSVATSSVESVRSLSAPTKTTITSSPSNVKTTKRWGNVVANVQNNDMLLTSFLLRRNGNRRKRLAKKLSEKKGSYREKPKINHDADDSKNKETSSGNFFTKALAPTTSCTSTTAENGFPTKESTCAVTAVVTTVASLPTANVDFTPVSSVVTSSSFNHLGSNHDGVPFSTVGKIVARVNADLDSQQTATDRNATNPSDVSAHQHSSYSCSIHNTDERSRQLTSSNTTENQGNIVRTMKDRTIKNKWLEMGKCQEEPSVNVTTPEFVNDQCASPVISYPNFKRKRGSTCDQGNVLEAKRKSQPKAVSGKCSNTTPVERMTSTFSAESLCQSDHRKGTDKKNVKSDLRMCKGKLKSKQHSQQQTQIQSQSLSIPTRKLNHHPTYPATLPTILNIFAPAPVPTSNIQQTNMPGGLSNFSAEALINNSCQMNMMGNNIPMQNYSNNMILPSNFTNFSADTLISDNDSNVTYAVNNLIGGGHNNPNHVPWNQSWLTPDMSYNDSLFNISNLQNNLQRNRHLPSTECSPIKSIMSILQSPNPNNSTAIETLDASQHLGNFLNNMSRLSQRPKRQAESHELSPQQNIWYNGNNNHIKGQQAVNMTSKLNFQQSSDVMFNLQSFQQNYINTMKPTPQNVVGGGNGETNQIQSRVNAGHVLPFQQFSLGDDNRTTRSKQGPTFGNYPLVNM